MVTIRRATREDIAPLSALVEQYREFYRQDPSERTAQFVRERMSQDESIIFVAEIDGRLVGFTQCFPSFSTVSLSVVWLLNDLFVEPDFRGRGIANHLMDATEAAARRASASRIWLRTAHSNAPARALYERRGWEYDEVFRRYDLVFGT